LRLSGALTQIAVFSTTLPNCIDKRDKAEENNQTGRIVKSRFYTGSISRISGALATVALCCALALAQAPQTPQSPIDADGGFLSAQGAQPRFESGSKISGQAEVALRQQRILSVPHFSGSFAVAGKTFPFDIVGNPPQAGITTHIATQLKPVTLLFEGYEDENGQPIVLSPEQVLNNVSNSPNFRTAQYQTGFTQFADAVQRAQFSSSMAPEWHTLLDPPQFLKPLIMVVPKNSARVFRNHSTGATYAVVDTGFFVSQLNTLVQMEDLKIDGLPIILTRNVLLAPDADVKRCCVLGFHTAFDAGQLRNTELLQTLVWASWMDAGILGSGIADVTALSHEISEWVNDPFGMNLVPAWQYPTASLGCQNNLETGDPLASLPNAGYPVTIDGFTFHPQNQVLFPWFTRSASDAVDHAYTFPDTSLLTSPAQACPAR
jgi:chitinase